MMPYVVNGLKAADEVKVRRRGLLIGMGAAMVIGTLVSYYSVLEVSYAHRAPYTGGAGDMRWLTSVLVSADTGTDWTNTGFMVGGSLFMGLLMWLRRIFVWWPPASNRVYNAQFLGLIQTVALNLYRLDDEVYSRQVRRIENVSRGETDIPWACAWRNDLRRNLGTYWNGQRASAQGIESC